MGLNPLHAHSFLNAQPIGHASEARENPRSRSARLRQGHGEPPSHGTPPANNVECSEDRRTSPFSAAVLLYPEWNFRGLVFMELGCGGSCGIRRIES